MKKIMQWVLVATLTCGTNVFTSCVDNSVDNPVVPEPEVPAVPDHFINEAWMDKTVRPGDDFYMYALGTWYTSHDKDDLGFWLNNDTRNTAVILNSLFTSSNPQAQHLVRNMKAPWPTLAEDVKAILDHLDIQKPTGVSMLLTEIGRLQDKGLDPIFSKIVETHPQTHAYKEIVSVGSPTNTAVTQLGQGETEGLKRFIRIILTTIDEVTDPECKKAEGYEEELEERIGAILDEESLIYNIALGSSEFPGSDQSAIRGVRDMPEYIEVGSIARSRATRADGDVKDEISLETLMEAFHTMDGCIVDQSPAFKEYMEQGGGITTVLGTMDRCYDYLRYYAVASLVDFDRDNYGSSADDAVNAEIVKLLGKVSPLLMNKLNYDILKEMEQGGVDRCLTILEEMRTLFRQRIETLDWLSDATRQEALKKLEAMQFYVGMPDKFSEGEFTLDEGNTLVLDVLSIMEQDFAIKHRLCGKKIEEEPLAAIDYYVNYGAMNAYYHPVLNALIILPQFLSEGMFPSDDEYTQYATTTVFGHEMTHGFDASGATYDERGYKRDWWQDEDLAKFETKKQEMTALYNRLEAYPGQKADGKKTLDENMADYGGATLAYTLFKQKKTAEGLQGAALDYACREFFLHYAKQWQRYYTLDDLKNVYANDTHSTFINRVKGIVPLFDDWYRLFGVTDGQLYLAPEQRVRIW